MDATNKSAQVQKLAALLGEAYGSIKDSALRRQLRERWEEYPSLKRIMNEEMRKRARSIAKASPLPIEGGGIAPDADD